MTISIMNAGRGAGKTYKLVEWAQQDPNHYVVGTDGQTGNQMRAVGLGGQFVHINKAYITFQGRRNYKVAIDNFQQELPGILHSTLGIRPETPVILASSMEEWGDIKTPDPTPVTTVNVEDVAFALMNRPTLFNTPEPDTQKVPLRSLRLGDKVVGRGRVVSVALDDDENSLAGEITVTLVDPSPSAVEYKATLRGRGNFVVEIEN